MRRGASVGGRRVLGAIVIAFVTAACVSPAVPPPAPDPPSSNPTAPPTMTPAAVLSAPSLPLPFDDLTALEAIDRAQAVIAGLRHESWLITAESRAEEPGGRLGAAREWLLLYRQLDGPIVKLTVPLSGEVTLTELPGGPWQGGRADRFRIVPAGLTHDSQAATRLGDLAGGREFLRRYPGTRRSIVLDHAMGDPLTWTVEYQSPDGYWVLTYIIEDATGDILHRSICEYTPAAMARPGLPNCQRTSERRPVPKAPPLETKPGWDLL